MRSVDVVTGSVRVLMPGTALSPWERGAFGETLRLPDPFGLEIPTGTWTP